MKKVHQNTVFLSSRMEGEKIYNIREKIKNKLIREGYLVKPQEKPTLDFKEYYSNIRDFCLSEVLNSDFLIAIIGYGYGNTSKCEPTGISLLESEIFQALFSGKPVWIFAIRSKENNLQQFELIKLLKKIVPDCIFEDIPEEKICDLIIKKLKYKVPFSNFNIKASFKDFITRIGILRQPIDLDVNFKHETRFIKSKELHFLNRDYLNIDNRCIPNQHLLNIILSDIQSETNYLNKLAETWKILRILLNFSFENEKNENYWEFWERALNIWVESASWCGLQGNLLIGGMAASNSLLDLNIILFKKNGGENYLKSVILSHNEVASQTYSTIKYTVDKKLKTRYFKSIFAHLNVAEELINKNKKLSENLGVICSTRGNILLSMRKLKDAIIELRRGINYEGQNIVPNAAIKVDLGYALMLNGNKFDAEKLMESGLNELEKTKRKGHIIRAKKKLFLYYLRQGAIKKALNQYLEAEALARNFSINDQLPPFATQLEKLRHKFSIKLGALQVIEKDDEYLYSARTYNHK